MQRWSESYRLQDVLQLVTNGESVHWLSEGDWSMHDLLVGLLMISGPADVYLSSYAFGEYPARIIEDLKNRKIIDKLYCLVDSRIYKRSASAFTVIQNCATQCKLVNTHAKVTIITNDKIQIVVTGSANYTIYKRYESGVIIAHPGVAAFHRQWMEKELNKL